MTAKPTKKDGKGKWWEGYDPQDLYAQNHKAEREQLGQRRHSRPVGVGRRRNPAYKEVLHELLQPHARRYKQV